MVSSTEEKYIGTAETTAEPRPHEQTTNDSLYGKEVEGQSETMRTTTHRGLKSRHAQMIALGGMIGTALFVGAGQGLAMGGPVSVFLAFTLITFFVYGIVTATGEMSAYLPLPGATVSYYADRYVSRSLGFALGWLYWYIYAIISAWEITAAVVVINYWDNPVSTWAWITIFLFVILLCNFLPVRVYGELEFWFAGTKVIGILGLISLTVVLFFGGGPKREPLWFGFWKNPGPTVEYLVPGASGRLVGFISTLTVSASAFTFAPEMLVVTSGEMQSPRRNIPIATRRFFYRMLIFYVIGSLCIGILVPSNNDRLLKASSLSAAASPWAIGIRLAGIRGLDSVVNAMVLMSAWSSGNSFLYLSSRSLYSSAVSGNAPAIFKRCNKSGTPYYATLASSAIILLSYLSVGSGSAVAFTWFVNLNVASGFVSWACVAIIYTRYRKATVAQGISDIPYRSRFQPYFVWISSAFFFLCMLLTGLKVFLRGHWSAATFFTSYIGIILFLLLFLGHRFTLGRNDKWMLRAAEIDLVSGLDEVLALEAINPLCPPEKWYMKWTAIYK